MVGVLTLQVHNLLVWGEFAPCGSAAGGAHLRFNGDPSFDPNAALHRTQCTVHTCRSTCLRNCSMFHSVDACAHRSMRVRSVPSSRRGRAPCGNARGAREAAVAHTRTHEHAPRGTHARPRSECGAHSCGTHGRKPAAAPGATRTSAFLMLPLARCCRAVSKRQQTSAHVSTGLPTP